MKRKQWLRGLAVTLGVTSLSGVSFGQNFGQPTGGGLAPSSYPIPTAPLYRNSVQQPAYYNGGYPSLAQNSVVPIQNPAYPPSGNYSSFDNPSNLVPSGIGNIVPQSQPQAVSLPPVQPSIPGQSYAVQRITTPVATHQPPMPEAQPPQPVPMPQNSIASEPQATGNLSGSCQTCNQPMGQVWSGYSSCQAPHAPAASLSGIGSPKPWIFGANGLIFNRIDEDYIRLSSNTVNSGPPVLSTFSTRMGTSGGVEVFGGRYFGCGKYALIGSYWGLYPADQTRIVYDPELDTSAGDTLRSDLPFTVLGPGGGPSTLHGIEMPGGANTPGPNGGQNAYDWYDNAYAHRMIRRQDFNNVEFNLFSFALGGAARHGVANCASTCNTGCTSNDACGSSASSSCSGCTGPCAPITGAQCSRLRFAPFAGIRWFRYGDYMEYASSENDATFGGADDFYYRNTVRNDLLGFQLGGRATYCTGRRINLYSNTKVGIFGNRVNYDTFAGTNADTAIVSSYNSYDDQPYDIQTATTGFSVLGEGELGMGVRLSSCWTANVGYRVVGVTGIATATGQIPYDFSLLNDVQRIHHDDSLVLHGVSIGGMYNW